MPKPKSVICSIIVNIILLLFVLLFSSNHIFAQVPGFRIQSYIPDNFADLEWTINASGNVSGNNSISNSNGSSYNQSGDFYEDRDNYRWRSLGIQSALNYRKETIPYLFNYQIAAGISYAYNNSTREYKTIHLEPDRTADNSIDQEENSYSCDLNQSVEYSPYIFNDFFISNTIDLKNRYWKSFDNEYRIDDYYTLDETTLITDNTIRKTDFDVEASSFRNSIGFAFMPGYGRMYEGNFAATALYFINELKKNGLLKKEPTIEQLKILSEIIMQNRQKHIIDSRIHRIESLMQIVEFFENNEIIDAPNTYGTLLLQDIWDYFPHDSRYFGFKIGFGIKGVMDYYRYSIHTKRRQLDLNREIDSEQIVDTISISETYEPDYRKGTDVDNNKTISVCGIMQYSKPLNLKTDINLALEGKYSLYSKLKDDNSTITYHDNNSFMLSFNIDYIPDSRSKLSLKTYYNYLKLRGENSDPDSSPKLGYDYWNYNISASISYRISIPTTIKLEISYDKNFRDGYYQQGDTGEDRYNIYFSVSHYII